MTRRSFLCGCIRHTGYALFGLAALCVVLEHFMPGFAAPYFNLYLLATIGLGLAVFGAGDVFGSRFGRWCVGGIWMAFFMAQVIFNLDMWGASLLLCGVVGFLIAFFLTSVYAEDL